MPSAATGMRTAGSAVSASAKRGAKGLGLAPLYHSFNEFYKRTGITIGSEHVTYEKEIRAGKEISVQSIQK